MLKATAEEIHRDRLRMGNQWAHVHEDGFVADRHAKQAGAVPIKIDLDAIRDPESIRSPFSDSEIDTIVRDLQIAGWKRRSKIWPGHSFDDPREILDPPLMFEALGYVFERRATLGMFETGTGQVEAAGYIDAGRKYVGISTQVPPACQRFTAAHELGHAVLHRPVAMHRDRALDGSRPAGPLDRLEREADAFATRFLMPRRLVLSRFEETFGVLKFQITDESAFNLSGQSSDTLRRELKGRRDLSRRLASASTYAGDHFRSLAQYFGVSVGTMAIRLEELDIV